MDVNQYSNILIYIDIMKSLHWYRPLDIENTQRKKHTPLKISNRTAVETSTKLPVTDLKQAPFQGAGSNLHRYKTKKNVYKTLTKYTRTYKKHNSKRLYKNKIIYGGEIIEDDHKKYIIFNDTPFFDKKERENEISGDVLGQGSWGKVIIVDDTHVAKVPITGSFNDHVMNEFLKEHNILTILNENKSIFQSNIKTVSSYNNLSTAHKIRGNLNEMKIYYGKKNEISFNKNEENQTSLLLMGRIYKTPTSTLNRIIKKEKVQDYKDNFENITKPYYLFLGRISKHSITGSTIILSNVDSIPLSCIKGVKQIELGKNFSLLFDYIEKNYSGMNIVVSNYIVSVTSPAYHYGKEMYKFIWNVFYKKNIILFDTEFILGREYIKQNGQYTNTQCYIIDFNRCEIKTDRDIESFTISITTGMELLNIQGTFDEHWGGFLPNLLISPQFAFDCLTDIINCDDISIEEYDLYLDFMILLMSKINVLLETYDIQVNNKQSFEIKKYYIQYYNKNHSFLNDDFILIDFNIFNTPKQITIEFLNSDEFVVNKMKKKEHILLQFIDKFCYLWKRMFILQLFIILFLIYVNKYSGVSYIDIIAKNKIIRLFSRDNITFIDSLQIIQNFNFDIIPTTEDIETATPIHIYKEEDANVITSPTLFGTEDDI
jgi:hypothetical protein